VIRENPGAPWLAVSVVCFGAFMGQLDASIVAITFLAMQRQFSAPVAAVQWVSLSGTALLVTSTSALLLPKTWSGRRRGLTGALLTCAVTGASVVVPVSQAIVVPQLALAGLGLGIFVPANNTVIMRGAADSSASLVGGLVSMARGIGTAFGISLMALAWHLGSHSYQAGNPGYSGSVQARPAFAVLAVVAATAAAIALASGARPHEPAERPREGSPSGADH
jgi:MFS family permease